MKRIFRIHKDWLNTIHLMSRAQILYIVLVQGSGNNGKEWYKQSLRKIWGRHIYRLRKDIEACREFGKDIPDMNIKKHLDMDKLKYFEIKEETFDIALEKNFSKKELQILFWLLEKYSNKNYRVVYGKVHIILKEIFRGFERPSVNRKLFLSTLDKFKAIQYSNPTDRLIQDYSLEDGGYIRIYLTPKDSERKFYVKRKK